MLKLLQNYFNVYFLTNYCTIKKYNIILHSKSGKIKDMVKRIYKENEKCTDWTAAEFMYISERTAQRRLAKLRKEKGYKPKFPVTIKEVADYYHINLSYT